MSHRVIKPHTRNSALLFITFILSPVIRVFDRIKRER